MSVKAVVSTDASSNEYNDASVLSDQYGTPPPEQQNSSFTSLKDRIRHHYELASEYYHSLWSAPALPILAKTNPLLITSAQKRGEHIHHGYFIHANDTKEIAQIRLIQLLLDRAQLPQGSEVLDVGCGPGGTARFLARHHDCHVTGITISAKQVAMATQLSADEEEEEAHRNNNAAGGSGFITVGGHGSVRFVELDAENMGHYFPTHAAFDGVWISEAMSHLPDKPLFFQNAINLLRPGGKLVVADWFRADDLTASQLDADIKPIEGRDGIAFLQAFRAMRRGYANGTFRYAVMIFQKPVEQEFMAQA
ncbi:MAG: hypothetical protein LQ352_008070 [Teloschistes flavicans]|nr:MAG: hypothetical protein LQ352_008070 [Teloschistes flavicans]